ncbi:MAG: peptidase T [Myxococcota bacterium]
MINFKDPQKVLAETSLVNDFLALVRFDTQSDESSETSPSTAKQLPALEWVKKRLIALGLKDAAIDENGYLFASLAGKAPSAPPIGLIAHIDTSPDFPGANVNPLIHENYRGNEIVLKNGWVISKDDTPELKECIGDTIITADGNTLLGADDKAGVAEILATLELITKNSDIKHPEIRVGITPDEEIGRGAAKFDIGRFGAKYAYTLDGGFTGEINSETFSADSAKVKITGASVHPGTAKGRLVNAIKYAARFVEMLPENESPETTEKREGFYHPVKIEGMVAEATVSLILRDFDTQKLKERGEFVKKLAEKLKRSAPHLKIEVEITESYRNMAEWLKEEPRVTELLAKAVELAGIKPNLAPIRGGTDGSVLTARGLPTPNIFAGGMNFHGPKEWVSTRVMALSVCTALNLLQLWAEER